ncbi:MAG: SDR family oxidoreductase [Vicinamibacterales bacterium]
MLVTGATRGIGRACVEAFAAAGGDVIAVARSATELDALSAACPHPIELWQEDVTTAQCYARIEQLKRLDILVNNAGTNITGPFAQVDEATLATLLDLNVRAAFRVSQSAARVMLRERTAGSIVHLSSQMGHVGAAQRTVYCMTKHAIEGLTKAMAVELAPHGIRVNSIAPTFVETSLTRPMLENAAFRQQVLDMIPLGRVAQVDDISSGVLFLASKAAAMITGTSLRVDGGWTAR